jgi:hypothetical protein
MRSLLVVEREPTRQLGGVAFGIAIEQRIGLFARQRVDEALGFTVGLRGVGPGAQVREPEQLARRLGEEPGGEGRAPLRSADRISSGNRIDGLLAIDYRS